MPTHSHTPTHSPLYNTIRIENDETIDHPILHNRLCCLSFFPPPHSRRDIPPRSLLKLALQSDPILSTKEIMETASSVSLLKAPPSWSVAGYMTRKRTTRSPRFKQCKEKPSDLARLASGVPRLMLSADDNRLPRSPKRTFEASPERGRGAIPDSQWGLAKTILFSNWAAESVPVCR